MNRFVLPFLSLFLLVMIGCTNNAPKSTYKEDAKEQILAQTDDIERFKLFPTQNMWTFIKLDTQTGTRCGKCNIVSKVMKDALNTT